MPLKAISLDVPAGMRRTVRQDELPALECVISTRLLAGRTIAHVYSDVGRRYLRRHRIRSGNQTIRVTVPREPAAPASIRIAS